MMAEFAISKVQDIILGFVYFSFTVQHGRILLWFLHKGEMTELAQTDTIIFLRIQSKL